MAGKRRIGRLDYEALAAFHRSLHGECQRDPSESAPQPRDREHDQEDDDDDVEDVHCGRVCRGDSLGVGIASPEGRRILSSAAHQLGRRVLV